MLQAETHFIHSILRSKNRCNINSSPKNENVPFDEWPKNLLRIFLWHITNRQTPEWPLQILIRQTRFWQPPTSLRDSSTFCILPFLISRYRTVTLTSRGVIMPVVSVVAFCCNYFYLKQTMIFNMLVSKEPFMELVPVKRHLASGWGGQGGPGPSQFLEPQTKVRFQQTHNQGLRQLLLTVSWDLRA